MAFIKQLTGLNEQTNLQEDIYPVTVSDAVINPDSNKSVTEELAALGGSVIDIDDILSERKYIDGAKWLVGNNQYEGSIIDISRYDTITLQAITNVKFALIQEQEIVNGANVLFAEGYTRFVSVAIGRVIEISVPTDAKYLWISRREGSTNIKAVVSMPGAVGDKSKLLTDNKSTLVAAINEIKLEEKQNLIGFSGLEEYTGHLDPTAITNDYADVPKYKVVKVYGSQHLVVSGQSIRMYILKDFTYNPLLKYNVSFASGETSRRNTGVDMVLPNDARYVVIQTINYQGINVSPSTLLVGSNDLLAETYTKKVDLYQGLENAGKALVVGKDGNVVVDSAAPYFADEVATTINSVRELQTEPCLVFPLITDIHYKANVFQNFDSSINNMKVLSESIPFDFVLNLGDNMDVSQKDDIFHMMNMFSHIKAPYYGVLGNHDVVTLTNEQIYAYHLSNVRHVSGYNQNNIGDYYVDFDHLNIRLIILNTNTGASAKYYSSSSASWLESVLAHGKINILAEHLSCINTHNYDLENVGRSEGVISVIQQFISGGGTVIELNGHTHADYAFSSPWLDIFNGCAKFEAAPSSYPAFAKITGYDGELIAPKRTEGTATEDLWSIVVVRPKARKINIVRFGAGEDREFSYQ